MNKAPRAAMKPKVLGTETAELAPPVAVLPLDELVEVPLEPEPEEVDEELDALLLVPRVPPSSAAGEVVFAFWAADLYSAREFPPAFWLMTMAIPALQCPG